MNRLLQRILAYVFILTQSITYAQISDDFSDGDFTSNPVWAGTDLQYVVNGSFELQLNNTTADTSYLSTAHGMSTLDTKEWRFWVKQAFSPSGGNYGRVYLTSNSADLKTNPDGFFLQFGEAGSNDAVRLFKHSGGMDVEIIAGTLGQISSSFAVSVRVIRDASANWALFVDDAGGQNYVFAGGANDPENLLGSHFGMLDIYTLSNANDFYYDDIYVGDQIIDTVPPILVSAAAISSNQIDVLFDEPLDQASAENAANYNLLPSISISTANLDGANQALVHLTLGASLVNGTTYTLNTNSIADTTGNSSGPQSTQFLYVVPEIPVPGDVLINEFLCDPTPSVGLSEVEFIEIYNISNKIFDVQNWKIGDASGDGTIQQDWLMPGDYMVLTSTSNVGAFGSATGVTSFPSLNNTGDDIVLKDDLGNILDMISYTDEWYHDPTKMDGGYTIERVNPSDPCSDIDNWHASTHPWGGTPAAVNSVFDNTADVTPPWIQEMIAIAPNQLDVYFNEGMDSLSLANAVVSTSPTLNIQSQVVSGSSNSVLQLQFVQNLIPSQQYSLQILGAADCWGNSVNLTGVFALPDSAISGDVIINEIMFSPYTGGSDWVELYNNSDKLVDLYDWEIANFDNDTIDNNKVITEHFYLYPDEYIVLAEGTQQIVQTYPSFVSGRFVQMDLPSLNADSSSVYLINANMIMDKVSYSEDWHFQLLDDFKGKSLERMDPNGRSDDQNNWHTAAEAIGFATPGMENSQFNPAIMNGDFSFSSETISPDNDGFEDVLQVNYQLTENGLVGDFTIFDDRGRKVTEVFKSELLASEGSFTWDGLKDDGTKASIGTYVAVFEAFSLDGEVKFAKRKAFVVAGKLN